MVLSACSPYFQALFVNHPEKHPIVILKDITFADMKSLLDFMYRGEVSVDQERLTAFLRVAESLRIKGLTEVNEDKPEKTEQNTLPTPQPQQGPPQAQSQQPQQQPTQPPQLHRIQPYLMQQQRKVHGMLLTNPLLGSALTGPKRKRGRPRKLSGSSTGNDFDDYESRDNLIQVSWTHCFQKQTTTNTQIRRWTTPQNKNSNRTNKKKTIFAHRDPLNCSRLKWAQRAIRKVRMTRTWKMIKTNPFRYIFNHLLYPLGVKNKNNFQYIF